VPHLTGQRQLPKEVPQVVWEREQLQPHLVILEPAFAVLEVQVSLQVLGGEAVDLVAVEDMMGWAQGSLR
jgi:hypothetical protein